MTYDTKCHALAVAFLTDDPDTTGGKVEGPLLDKAAADLAQQIQDLIEGFIEFDLVELRKEQPAPDDEHDYRRDPVNQPENIR